MQSSLSNLHDGRIYGKSPLGSPIYQQAPLGYTTSMTPAGFRTLQHPRTGKAIAIAAQGRSHSPFTPAPLLLPQTVMKAGYVTIPRKPRTPSWAPSANSTVLDFPPTSPTSMASTATSNDFMADPIYDNLGMRTTASGYSTLELNKKHGTAKYTMRDRPLPATPTPSINGGISVSNISAAYEPVQEQKSLDGQSNLDTEPLYGGGAKLNGLKPTIVANGKPSKVPPRPPPKPKKKPAASTINATQTSTSQLIEESEDGTEV